MVLCISGNYRSGKSGFGVELAKELGIKYYSMRTLKDKKITKYNTDFVDWSQEIDLSDNLKIDDIIVEIAKQGDCILDFRYSALLCKKNNIEYIGFWVFSNMESRIYGNAYCWNKSLEETKKILLQREENEKKVCIDNYNYDYSSREYYKYFIELSEYWYPIEKVSKKGFLFEKLIKNVSEKIKRECIYVKDN